MARFALSDRSLWIIKSPVNFVARVHLLRIKFDWHLKVAISSLGSLRGELPCERARSRASESKQRTQIDVA
jgi:hypothetical protein